jgi:hypothetical protein
VDVSGRLIKFIVEGRGLAEANGRTYYCEKRTRQTNKGIKRRKVRRHRGLSLIPVLGLTYVTETLHVSPHMNVDVFLSQPSESVISLFPK